MVWTRKPAGTAPAAAPASTGAPPPPTSAAPAGLPPVPPPAPAAPPAATQQAAAPAAAPAARRGGRRAAAETAAPAPQGAPTAPPATQPATNAVTQAIAQLPGFLAALTPRHAGPSALSTIIDGKEAAGEPNLFPTMQLSGGDAANGGGSLQFHSMNPEGSNADLPPIGKAAIPCILLGARFEVLFWPKAYQRGVKMMPKSKAIIAYDEAEAVDAAQRAVQRYTFRNRSTQDQYDAVGHPAMLMELLVYDPQGGLFCLQTSGSYDGLFKTAEEMSVAFPVVQPTPVIITPHTYKTRGSKTQEPWDEHCLQVRQDNNSPEMQAIKTEFNKFLQENAANPELGAAIAEWAKHTLSAAQLEDLRAIGSL